MSKKSNDTTGEPADKWQKLNTQDTAEGDIQQQAVTPEHVSGFEGEAEPVDADVMPEGAADAATNAEVALRSRVKELEEQLLREAASQRNLHARMEREVQSAHKYSAEKFIKAMLPVVDSLERALDAPEQNGDAAMRDGVKMTIAMFEKVLKDNGVAVISPEAGEAFDPEQHEAMSAQSDPNFADGAVLGVLQKGYDLNGRVVRAAMVVVDKL